MRDDFQAQISRLVDAFVGQVSTLARQAAMETLNTALGLQQGALARRIVGRRPKPVVSSRPKGAKRPQAELAKMRATVVTFIQANPGLRVEQINKQLGTSTRDLALPLRKLVAEGALRTEGEKRSTQYFPGEVKPKAAAPAPRRRTKR